MTAQPVRNIRMVRTSEIPVVVHFHHSPISQSRNLSYYSNDQHSEMPNLRFMTIPKE